MGRDLTPLLTAKTQGLQAMLFKLSANHAFCLHLLLLPTEPSHLGATQTVLSVSNSHIPNHIFLGTALVSSGFLRELQCAFNWNTKTPPHTHLTPSLNLLEWNQTGADPGSHVVLTQLSASFLVVPLSHTGAGPLIAH